MNSFKLNELQAQYGNTGSYELTNPNTHIAVNVVSGWAKFFSPAFLSFCFGGFYFLFHKMWGIGLVTLFLSIVTSGCANIFYPFFAKKFLVQHYLKEGYEITRFSSQKRKIYYTEPE